MTTRKSRGAETELRFAEYLAEHGWDHAQASRSHGSDVVGTPGLVWELKARKGFTPSEWLRQVRAHGAGLPIAVLRPDGYGPAHIDEWVALLRVGDLLELLHDAGYGTEPTPSTTQPNESKLHP